MNCPEIRIGCGAIETDQWPLVLTKAQIFETDRDFGGTYHFYSGDKLLAIHKLSLLVILGGYASDGYSPVKRLFGKWIRFVRTPKCGFGPAVIHDLTRQFLNTPGCPWDRKQTDDWFYNCLRRGGEPHTGIFHRAVAGSLGTAYIWMTRKTDPQLRIVKIS
jgi:hypothetical protein